MENLHIDIVKKKIWTVTAEVCRRARLWSSSYIESIILFYPNTIVPCWWRTLGLVKKIKREVSLAVVSLWDLVVTIVVYMRVCVCVCVVTHGNHRRSSPLHVSLFILQPFERLTETNDSASEMSSRPTHKQVEGGGKWDGEEGVKKKSIAIKRCSFVLWLALSSCVTLRNWSLVRPVLHTSMDFVPLEKKHQ